MKPPGQGFMDTSVPNSLPDALSKHLINWISVGLAILCVLQISWDSICKLFL